MTTIQRLFFNLQTAIFAIILFSIFPVSGVGGVDPKKNPVRATEIDATINIALDELSKISKIADMCRTGDCPELDCETAQKVNELLFNINFFLKYTRFWTYRELKVQEGFRIKNRESVQIAVDYQKSFARFNLAKDAYSLSSGLLSSDGRSWLKCAGKLGNCSLRPHATAAAMPGYAEVTFYGDDLDLAQSNEIGPDGKRSDRWGKSEQYLDQQMLAELAKFSVPETKPAKPSLKLAKSTFKPGENVTVAFTAPPCYHANSWFGLVPGGIAHGNNDLSFDNSVAYELLKNRPSGEREFKGPQKEGDYEIRMFERESGREMFSVSFKVKKEDEKADPKPGNNSSQQPLGADDLEGVWKATGYQCDGAVPSELIRITASGNVLTATKLKGDRCINDGEITWKGTFARQRFDVEFQVTDGPGSKMRRWLRNGLEINDWNTLKVFGVTYTRQSADQQSPK